MLAAIPRLADCRATFDASGLILAFTEPMANASKLLPSAFNAASSACKNKQHVIHPNSRPLRSSKSRGQRRAFQTHAGTDMQSLASCCESIVRDTRNSPRETQELSRVDMLHASIAFARGTVPPVLHAAVRATGSQHMPSEAA